MVLANSTWVRPAQALVYSEESGEVRHFPPRNRGTLPRALTFGDSQDCWRNNVPDQILSPFAFQQVGLKKTKTLFHDIPYVLEYIEDF